MAEPRRIPKPMLANEPADNRTALAELLTQEPKPQPTKLTVASEIAAYAADIRACIKAGHSLATIAELLQFGGDRLNGQQLRRYLARAEKRLVRKGRAKKSDASGAPPSATPSTPPSNGADRGTTAPKTPVGSEIRQTPPPPPARPEAPVRPPALPNASAAAPQTTLPLPGRPQGTTASTVQHAPAGQAQPIARSIPPTPVSPAGTPGAGTGTPAKTEAGPTTSGLDGRTTAPNVASASTSTTAKPQSTASPELSSLPFEARNRSFDRLLGTERPEANVDQPRQSNLLRELDGQLRPSSADGAQAGPPLASTTRP